MPAAYGGVHEALDVRSLALIRETLARHSGLADFAFAMQGLGSGTISLFGTEAQKRAYLPAVAQRREDRRLRADRADLRLRRRRDGDAAPARPATAIVVDGAKT